MERCGILRVVFSLSLFLLLSSSSSLAYEVINVGNGGTIVGTVKFQGKGPQAKKIVVTRNKEVCGKEAKLSESLIVGSNGGVRNTVLFLTDVKKGKKFDTPSDLQLDQRGCQFRPHVFIVPAGKSFDLINSDGILHNFRTTGTKNPILNKAQPKFKKKLKIKIDQPEIIRVNCDVHEWMKAWLVVAEHPYYVLTEENGSFKIPAIPPGTYTLQLWHETLGQQTRKVTVKGGSKTKVEFKLKKK